MIGCPPCRRAACGRRAASAIAALAAASHGATELVAAVHGTGVRLVMRRVASALCQASAARHAPLTAAASAESTHTVCAQLASSERHGSKEERRAGDQPSLLSLITPCWRDRLNSIYETALSHRVKENLGSALGSWKL